MSHENSKRTEIRNVANPESFQKETRSESGEEVSEALDISRRRCEEILFRDYARAIFE